MSVNRIQRLNVLLQRELGEIFEVYIRPQVPGALVTVTGVEVAPNLRNANVFVSVYGAKGAPAKAMEALQRKRHLIQADVARRVIMKYTPVLNFKLDDTAERADRVEKILQELNLPEETPAADASAEPPPQE